MANHRQLRLLREGVLGWNKWRKQNKEFIDLSGSDFRNTDILGADLSQANLAASNFEGKDLKNMNFSLSNLSKANFHLAKLNGTNFSKANLAKSNIGFSDLEGANLSGANLSDCRLAGNSTLNKADLSWCNLSRCNLWQINLSEANLKNAILLGTNLREAILAYADLSGATLTNTNLEYAFLRETNFHKAKFINVNLSGANLQYADLSDATLNNTSLRQATLVQTNISRSKLQDCNIYGISVWDLEGTPQEQSDLIITPEDQTNVITVDNLQVAQFIYLLLNNKNIRSIIDTVTSKTVLILGRFTEERKIVLDAIREELRKHNFTPILFDFDGPVTKDVTGTVETLARMARFIIADLTDPSSLPHELATIIPFLRTTPILPIRLQGASGYTMFDDFKVYPWVSETHEYKDCDSFIRALPQVIAPANEKAEALRKKL